MQHGRVLDWGDSSDSDSSWGWETGPNAEQTKTNDSNSKSGSEQGFALDQLVGCVERLSLDSINNNSELRARVKQARRRGVATKSKASRDPKEKTSGIHATERLLRACELAIERSERQVRDKMRAAVVGESKGISKQAKVLSFQERCALESAALLSSAECPEHFRAVDQVFPRLEPAKTCANQHNMVGDPLPEKAVVFSRCGDVPERHRKTGLLRFGGWDDQGKRVEREKDALEDAPLPTPEVLFDFSKNAGQEVNADVYSEKVELSEKQEQTAEDLKRQYLDILGKLNVDLGTKKPKVVQGTMKKEHGTDGKEQVKVAAAKAHYPRDHPQALRIFAIQDFSKFQDEPGRKKTTYRYRVCPLSKAWQELKNCEDQSKMHWYEIIREGFPCHLYFDLEYPKGPGLNVDLDDDALVDALLGFVGTRLKSDFDLDLHEDQIYELDSTTDRKFSRHLVVKIPGHAFYSVDHVGYFVQQVCADSGSELLVRQHVDSERLGYIVDTGVYTKNRLFRLAYNCKCGGTGQTLQPTPRFATALPQTPAHVFASTLVTCMDADGGGQNIKLLAVRRMLSMPQAVLDVTTGVEGCQGAGGVESGVEEKPIRQDANTFMPSKEAMARLSTLARQAIPFVQTYATNRAGKPVSVKSWQILGGYGDVAYSLSGPGAHFCSNKGGDHDSNFVYIVANFYLARVAQKCFDQETCYKYKSPHTQMPEKFRWNPQKIANNAVDESSL